MKTAPMDHQTVGVARLQENFRAFLLACEQGTGKTWMFLNDAELNFKKKRIEAALVIAPKGVHTNWVRREIPTHLEVPVRAAAFSSGASRKAKNEIERLFKPANGVLIVLAMNIDAINHKEGYSLAVRFMRQYETAMVIDESGRIKNPEAKRTEKAIALGYLAVSKRCMSGTPIVNSPADIFAQFEFLAPKKRLLGTTSYRAFVAEYTELLPTNHHLMNHTKKNAFYYKKLLDKLNREVAKDDPLYADKLEKLDRFLPQIPVKDDIGRPQYKNLDKLNKLLEPYMYRVLKKDCMDLPEKIYKTSYYDLEGQQLKNYELMRDKLRYERENGEIDTFTALTKMGKLQQVVSGFIMLEGEVTTLMDAKDNPRMQLLRDTIEDIDGSFIIWARFKEELKQIAVLLKEMEITFVEYHGDVKGSVVQEDGTRKELREIAIDDFQSGKARCFSGNAQAGGIGLTLTKAETVIYYSQSFSLEERLQSEDRCHRKGTVTNPVYIDIAATDTIDERISAALQSKEITAKLILDGV